MAMYSDAEIKEMRARAARLQEPTKRIEQAGNMLVPYSPWEGIADTFKQGYGTYLDTKATIQEREKEKSLQDTLNEARVAMMGKPEEYDPKTQITWNAVEPDPNALAGILMSNPQTADQAIRMSIASANGSGTSDTALIRNYQAWKLENPNGTMSDFINKTRMSSKGIDSVALNEGQIPLQTYADVMGMNQLPSVNPQPQALMQPPQTFGPNNPALNIQQDVQPISMADMSAPVSKITQAPPAAPNVNTNKINADALAAGAVKDAQNQSDLAVAGPKQMAVDNAKIDVEGANSLPKQLLSLLSFKDKQATVNDSVNNAIDNSGYWTNGFVGAIGSFVPGTPQYDLGQNILTIKSNIGFDKLQEMRDQSPTGGALGQVAVQELQSLQATFASIEQAQTPEQFVQNLKKIPLKYDNMMRRLNAAFELDKKRFGPKATYNAEELLGSMATSANPNLVGQPINNRPNTSKETLKQKYPFLK